MDRISLARVEKVSFLLTLVLVLASCASPAPINSNLTTATTLPPTAIPVVAITVTSAPVTEAPTQSSPTASGQAAGSGQYAGDWAGNPVKFTVQGDTVISELYLLKDCGIASTPGSEAKIDGNKFVVTTSPATGIQVTIEGQFDSATSASGTISATGGGCEMKAVWTATK